MIMLGTYEIIEKIMTDRKKVLYRAADPVTGDRLLIKVFQDENRYVMDSFILKNEFDMLSSINLPNCIKALRIENIDGYPAMVMKDDGGLPLREYLQKHQLNITQKLHLADKIASVIAGLHAVDVVHKNINPMSILVVPTVEDIILCDFSLAERMGKYHESSFVGMGNPAYISPEQTGRTSRSVDNRSDIYSLGIVYYELFCSRHPFTATDISGLFYAHLTMLPVSPEKLGLNIPTVLSNIIMKMIQKEPDDRYKSVKGMQSDLEWLIRSLGGDTANETFELAKSDVSTRFMVPLRPIGKAQVFDTLEEIRSQILRGESRIVLLTGERGSGRTYVLNELYRRWVDKRGQVLYVDLTANETLTPYQTVRLVSDRFVDLVLNSPIERVDLFKEKLTALVGSNINLLVTVLPSFKKLIAYEPDIQAIDQYEHKPLIERMLLELSELMLSFESVSIVLVDGFSRVDAESARVLLMMMQQPFMRALMVVGTLESHETLRPDFVKFKESAEDVLSLDIVELPEYSEEDIKTLIRDAFGLKSKKASHLSRLIFSKTSGNPYYTMEFVKRCCEEDWIFFDTDFGGWDYKASEIERFQTTSNVADRALEKLKNLESYEIEILTVAAGLGLEFSLENLSEVANIDSDLLSGMLSKALNYGLIAGRFSITEDEAESVQESLLFRFSHESIYKHLIDSIDELSRMEISYAIGHLLMEKGTATTEELGQLLSHMNFAIPLLRGNNEKRDLARLNLEYAIRLKWIGVFEKALSHAEIGLELLASTQFQETDSLSFRLSLERAELAYLNRRFDEAEAYFDALIGNCLNPINQAKAIRIKMVLYVNQGKMKETIVLAENALKALGVSFDGAPTDVTVGRELLIYNISTLNKKTTDLEKLPVSTDSEIFLITQIYMTLISVSYLVGKNLFIYVILRILNLTLKHGLTVHSSYAFSIYGLIAGSALGNPLKGLAYGDLGIRLAERFGNQDILAKCEFTYGFFLNHWVNHPSSNLPHLTKAIELSYQTGDMVFYSYSVAAYILSLLDAGTPLNDVLRTVNRYFGSVQDKQVEDVFNLLVLLRQVIFTLQGLTDSPYSLNAVDFDESGFEGKLKSSSMQSINAVYLVQKLKLYYLYGKYESAFRVCTALQGYAQELMGLSVYPEYYQYYSMTLLEMGHAGQGRHRTLKNNQKKLAKWMRNAPQNFSHRHLMVQGLWQFKRGHRAKAVLSLTEALQIAQKQGFLQDEALINELLGRCYDDANQVMIRRMYLKNAYTLYKQWGATAKETYLKDRYSDIAFDEADRTGITSGLPGFSDSGDVASKQVDLLSVFKSAQTLSSETKPKELLKRLLEIIAENAGSQKTVILMKKESLVPVGCSTPDGVAVNDNGEDFRCEYPETIINQVARSLEPALLEDVASVAVLRKDPYIARINPVSLMCIPILWKGSLTGVLYLENNRMIGAFNSGRMEIMQVLTAQFVISYDNALLYENLRNSESELKEHKYKLERIVEERTAELSRANFEIQMLLDHAGQGFFSFDHTGRIGSELSRECYRIFQKNLCGESVSELLGSYCEGDEAPLIGRIVEKAFNTIEAFDAKVYLSLLPQELQVRDKNIAIEYQMIDDSDSRRVMTILTDVTETHALMKIREEEKRNLKMIVRVIKNRNSFLRSLEDYVVFTHGGCRKLVEQAEEPQETLTELFRMVHTFKGDFAQWGFSNTEAALHEIESLIACQRNMVLSGEGVEEFIEELDFDKAIEKDLMILENAIGKSFLQGDEYYEISRAEVLSLEELAENNDIEALRLRIRELRRVNIKELLIPYNDYVAMLAFGLDKKVNPLQVVGEDIRVDRKHYYNLIKVLTHIFRNMMDYGIESPDERLQKEKAEYGTITCRIRLLSDAMMALEMEDDGSGIDPQKLLDILIQRNPERKGFYLDLSHEDLLQLIFSDGVSTSGDITMLSGRGIGLSAVREEVEKLNGTIRVDSSPGMGTRFILELPVV